MKVLMCGGRNFDSYSMVSEAMSKLPFKPTLVAQGEAIGADRVSKMWAMSEGITTVGFPALWDAHGKGAGHRRNQAMIDIIKPDYCVAFPGGRGTSDMVKRCKNAGITVYIPFGGVEE